MHEIWLTGVVGWARRWRNYCGKGAIGSRSVSTRAVMELPRYSVQTYMNGVDGQVYSDAHQLKFMRYYGDEHFVLNAHMHENWLTDVGGWAIRWRN